MVGYLYMFCYKFPTESNSERILKIGQHLVKLWARVRCLVFFDSQCSYSYHLILLLGLLISMFWLIMLQFVTRIMAGAVFALTPVVLCNVSYLCVNISYICDN